MHTSMRIDTTNRDELARIAATELGGVSLDEALRIVLFERETRAALIRLRARPGAETDYLREATQLAETDNAVAG